MRIAKWGNSLAVRIPASVVDAMELQEGDDVDIHVAADGAFADNLALADTMKERSFLESITSGKFHNQIAAGVESALTCMLGRTSAELGREVTWDEHLLHHKTAELGMNISQFT